MEEIEDNLGYGLRSDGNPDPSLWMQVIQNSLKDNPFRRME